MIYGGTLILSDSKPLIHFSLKSFVRKIVLEIHKKVDYLTTKESILILII